MTSCSARPAAWLIGTLYADYTALIAIQQASMVRRLERQRRAQALMLASGTWAASFLLTVEAPLLPHSTVGPIVVVAARYTTAVILLVGLIDALVVEATPDQIRSR